MVWKRGQTWVGIYGLQSVGLGPRLRRFPEGTVIGVEKAGHSGEGYDLQRRSSRHQTDGFGRTAPWPSV